MTDVGSQRPVVSKKPEAELMMTKLIPLALSAMFFASCPSAPAQQPLNETSLLQFVNLDYKCRQQQFTDGSWKR